MREARGHAPLSQPKKERLAAMQVAFFWEHSLWSQTASLQFVLSERAIGAEMDAMNRVRTTYNN